MLEIELQRGRRRRTSRRGYMDMVNEDMETAEVTKNGNNGKNSLLWQLL